MSWIDRVKCTQCTDTNWLCSWLVDNGSWTCFYCGHVMTLKQIKDMHHLEDCERWLAAKKEWSASV